MEIIIALAVVVCCFAAMAVHWIRWEKQYAARVAALEKREREIALREANEGTDLPIALHKWITRSARIVLKNFPLSAGEREMVAATATVGALLNVNDAIGKSINAYIETAGLDDAIYDAPIHGPGTAEFKATDDDDFDDDDDMPDISDDDDDMPDISDRDSDSDPGNPPLQ